MKTLLFLALIYPATLDRVIDGDTQVYNIEVWPNITVKATVRLNGINTPEVRTTLSCEKLLGLQASKFVENSLAGQRVGIEPITFGKYGRVIGNVYVNGNSLANELIFERLAVYYDGQTKATWDCDNHK